MDNQRAEERIGLFGGTFNPPHLGHQRAAVACVEQLGLSRLLLIPASLPPHKKMPEGSATPEQRLRMAELMAQSIPRAQVSEVELRREGPSYTCDTVKVLRQHYPDGQFWLIMGTDMFLSFHQWRQPEQIVKECRLAVVARERRQKELLEKQAAFLEKELGARCEIVSCPVTVLSSTEVRDHLPHGLGEPDLSPEVAQYIREEGLYSGERRLEMLRREVRKNLSEKRWKHTLGVEQTAAWLAQRYGESEQDAREAALLHDATKCLGEEEQLKLCHRYGIILDYGSNRSALVHADTAAALARERFGVSPRVEQAIARHTTGSAGMSCLDKIIYLADCIEPGRDYPGVDELRRLCRENLDDAMEKALEESMQHVRQRGGEPDRRSQQALDDLKRKKENGK